MTAANEEIRAWARAQGERVASRGNLPGRIKEAFYAEFPDKRPPGSVALLPGPDDDLDAYDDLGLLEPYPEPAARSPEGDAGDRAGPRRYQAVPDEPEAVTADPEPAHASKEWRKTAGGRETPKSSGRSAPRKVTVTVRTDIAAKIGLVLEVPGRVWQARDPVCGTAFTEQRPAIADALTEIVCNSPDLVAWFTGSGGQFMLWFNLVMACWPVAMTVTAHHVYHTAGEGQEDMTQPDYGTYAA